MAGTPSSPTGVNAARVWAIVIGAMFAVYLIWLVLAPTPVLARDLGLYTLVLLACASAVLQRVRLEQADRLAWLLIGTGLLIWTASDAYYTVQVNSGVSDFPSAADWGYLAFFPLAYLAVGLLVVRHVARSPLGVWLDGFIVALAAGAGLWLLIPYLSPRLTDDWLATFMHLATPASDLLLLSGLIGVVALLGSGAGRMWWSLLAAAAILWATDSLWLLDVVQGQYRLGLPLDVGWLVAFMAFAAAAWMAIPGRTVVEDKTWAPLSAAAAGASFLLLLFATQNRVPVGSVLLAATAVVLGVFRGAQTVRAASAYQQAKIQATRDELTGVANRRRLVEMLSTQTGVRAGALLLVDIDGFKWVNDSLGHAAGDEVLVALAPRLLAQTDGDDVVARLGGDEFAVFLTGVTEPGPAFVVAEALRQAVARPLQVSDMELQIDLSIGIALAPRDATTLSDLLRSADSAMYRAKRSRIGIAAFEAEDQVADRGQLLHLQELRNALADDQLTCVYQPKVDLGTGRVAGVEALVRWQHPQRGEIPPAEFMPYAEHSALIRPLMARTLEVAVAQAAAWMRSGVTVTMSVNLSATNLLDPRLTATIQEILVRHGVPPGRLMLEITESVFVADPERATRVITALTDMGLRLSVDDYGTGFSSLSQIRNLATEELKLDASFVQGVATRQDLQTVVAATVLLAHGLGLTLVAEGVQSQEDLDVLADLGVDLAQGFHICPPLPGPAVERWLATYSTVPRQRAAGRGVSLRGPGHLLPPESA